MPERIAYDAKVARLVKKLIVEGQQLEGFIDEEQYPPPVERPAVKAAWAIQAAPWAAWHSASYSILRSVCGSDGHPMLREWYRFCSDAVVDCCRRGVGLLRGFLRAWQAGALWAADEVPPDDKGIVR